MRPKFSGMNPYLENPELWSEVHFGLIAVMARSINAVITPRYRAAVEKRVYVDSLLVGIPDVAVFQRGIAGATDSPQTTAILSKPIAVTVPVVEETQERFLEIREVGTGIIVAVVEVLSPKSKRTGEFYCPYVLAMQNQLWICRIFWSRFTRKPPSIWRSTTSSSPFHPYQK